MRSNFNTFEDPKMESERASRNDVGTEMDEDEEHGNSLYLRQIDIIPEVRRCDLLHFKNHFNAAEEGLYAIDVLESDSFLDQEEIQEERRLRQSLPKNRVKAKSTASNFTSKLPPQGKPLKSTSKQPQGIRTGQPDSKFISRIRIRSPAILLILSKIMQESWGNRPRTFIRPFSPLIYFHPQVLEFLRELELKWGQQDDTLEAARTPASLDEVSEGVVDEDKVSVDDSAAALADLNCYVQFMSSEIMPLYSRFDNLDETSNAKIRFHDLWYLFKIGELIYRPVGGGAIQESNNFVLGQRACRIYGTIYGTHAFGAGNGITPVPKRNHISDDEGEKASFEVECYYIDYTGDEFCVVTQTFEIHPYEGERPIKSLKVFPFRFLADHKERLYMYTEYGRRFLRSIEERHAAYNWWTVIRTP
jgi:hypothetical protein